MSSGGAAVRGALLQVLPEIDEIGDAALRESVIATWLAVLQSAGAGPGILAEMPASMRLREASFRLIHHIRAVTRLADAAYAVFAAELQIALSRDRILAGALLHDVGKVLEFSREGDDSWGLSYQSQWLRHPFTGTVHAAAHGVPDDVLHIIAYHSQEGELLPRTIEGEIVHLADDLSFKPAVMAVARQRKGSSSP